MLISLWTWGLVWPGQTNIPIGKQIVKGNLFKKVACAKERRVCVWFFSPLPHWPGNVLYLQPSTVSVRNRVQGHQSHCPLFLMHQRSGQVGSTLPWAVVGGGEHYLRYRCRMGSLFIHFQDASHKFSAEWLRSLKSKLWRGLAISDVFVVCSLHLY